MAARGRRSGTDHRSRAALDDQDLFFSNWLHGDLRYYDVPDPTHPVLRSQVWLGGLLGRDGRHPKASEPLNGGPQMLQNSLDGDRVYVTNSLFSTWDSQFYPEIKGWLTKLDRQSDGSYALDPDVARGRRSGTPSVLRAPSRRASPARALAALAPARRSRAQSSLLTIFSGVLVLSHVPAIYGLTLRNDYVHEIEQALYLFAAVLMWASILGVDPFPHRATARGGLANMLACVLLMAVIAVWLATARDPVYGRYLGTLGPSALHDQRLAATIM